MRKYNISGHNVNLGFDKECKILYIKPNESNKVITLYINTGNMLLLDALDIKFNISSANPNIMQPRKLQYLLSAAGIKKRDIMSIITAPCSINETNCWITALLLSLLPTEVANITGLITNKNKNSICLLANIIPLKNNEYKKNPPTIIDNNQSILYL